VATYTINASSTNVGRVRSYSNSGWSGARSGTKTLTADLTGYPPTGQYKVPSTNFYVYQSYLEFDTSGVVGTITSAVLKINVYSRTNDQSYDIEARLFDFGAGVTTADYIAGASLGSYTLLATLADTAATPGAYRTFTDVAMAANINVSGTTRIMLCDSRTRSDLSPSNSNYIVYENGGDPSPPQLVITTSDPTGTLTGTLGAVTSSATGTLEIAGAATPSLADLTLSSTATISGTQEGLLNKSLDDLTVSSTIAIETFGYTEVTLGALTLSTVALVDLNGSLTATLGALTTQSVIARDFNGALTATLDALTLGSVNIAGRDASVTATLGALTLQAVESGPPWPVQYDFPQSPLDGTWRRERGDDTLRSDRAVGARQYRTQNGGNYADVTFAIMLKSKTALDLLDRFFRDDCKNGAKPFYWIDPETGDSMAWLWAAPPQIRHVARETYRVDCALLKEAA
jgi:hypothetical protein